MTDTTATATVTANAAQTPMGQGAEVATAPKTTSKVACECSKYEILVNVRESDTDGDLIWDEEITTDCTSTTARLFAPGHDAKLKGFLIRAELAGHEVSRTDGAMRVSGDAASFAKRYDFGHMVVEGIRLGKEKDAAKAAKKAKKIADKEFAEALREAKVTVVVATPAPVADEDAVAQALAVTAKVGRWEYKGELTAEGFSYTDGKGVAKVITTGYTVI